MRVLRPGKQLPFDLKQYQPKIPDLAKTVCAIIEFEAADAAKFAVQTLRYRTKELGFRLALLESGAEEDLYGAMAEPQLPMLKPGQSTSGITDESGIELSGSGRSSGSDRDSDRHSDCAQVSPKSNRKDRIRAPSSASESENERRVKLTEKWNPNVQAFIPGNFTSSPKKQQISTTATVAINDNGRIITSVSISLSKPTKGRLTSKIALVPNKSKQTEKSIQYSRDFLLSLRSSQKSLDTPKITIDDEFKRYTPPQRRHSHAPVHHQQPQPLQLAPQRRNSHLRR